jgi:hypothetical protein
LLVSYSSTPGENDPTFNLSALTAQIDRTTATARQAGIETLHQMFPSLDEDVAGVVLDSCDGDLGMAIDRYVAQQVLTPDIPKNRADRSAFLIKNRMLEMTAG